jgi:hypothetical protein
MEQKWYKLEGSQGCGGGPSQPRKCAYYFTCPVKAITLRDTDSISQLHWSILVNFKFSYLY